MNGSYEFVFTRGIDHLRSIPHDLFRMDVRARYQSKDLIFLFKNRLPPRGRTDFAKMARWLNLRGDEEEFVLLAKFGLIPGTDSILVYPEPDVSEGTYQLEFFVHGIRHMHSSASKWCAEAEEGGRLFPLLDVQNPVDPNAVALRAASNVLIGYVPAFYAGDLKRVLLDSRYSALARISILRNNVDAPIQLRLLCRFTSPVSQSFRVLDTADHEPLLVTA
jgi:hypothetical protein